MKRTTRKLHKVLLTLCCALALVAISVGATLAYLTDTDTVNNTFTVGNVQITLDETDVDLYGEKDGDTRVKWNEYKLLPGHEYIKDPTVHVQANSEPCYVRMLVTIDKQPELDAIFAPDGADLTTFFGGVSAKWVFAGETEDTANNTRTYEFRYFEVVDAREEVKNLDPLFTTIKVPGTVTNDQLATITGLNINIVAHAIQADGFENAEAAWAAWGN